MLAKFSWAQYAGFVVVALILYYLVVGFIYYRAEIMARLTGGGKPGAQTPAPSLPRARPTAPGSLVSSSSAFAPPASVEAAAPSANGTGPKKATEEQPASLETTEAKTDDATTDEAFEAPAAPTSPQHPPVSQLTPEQMAALVNFKPGSENMEEVPENESLGNQKGTTLVTLPDEISNPSDLTSPAAPALVGAIMAEPAALAESSESLEMIELLPETLAADETANDGLLIGADNLQEILSQVAMGNLTREQLQVDAPELEDTAVIEQFFATSKSRRRNEIQSLLDDAD